jgi:hypothetical protein
VFKNTDGVKFRGTSWATLAAKVTEYRTTNGFPVGDVMAEIIAQVCKSSPSFCRESGSAPRVTQPRKVRQPDAVQPTPAPAAPKGAIVARVTNWIHALLAFKRKSAIVYVAKSESARRLSICAACPKLVTVSGSCGGCMTALAQAKAVLLAGQAKVSKPIAGCKELGEDTGVSAYIVQPASGQASLPANCWRRAS